MGDCKWFLLVKLQKGQYEEQGIPEDKQCDDEYKNYDWDWVVISDYTRYGNDQGKLVKDKW